jgi:hypothetical protein
MPVPSPRNKILPVRGNIATLTSNVLSISEGEICYALDEDKLYVKEGGVLVAVSGAGGVTGGGADQVFYENDNTVTTDYSISANRNAISAGPITVNSGVTVTIPATSNWVIV